MAGVAALERLDPRTLDRVRPPGTADLGPWTSDQLVRVVAGNAIAAAMMAASWFQLSGEVTVRGQLTWLNVGFVGLGAAGASNALWLLRGRTNVGRARAALLPDRAPRDPSAATPGATQLVTANGMTRFHSAACVFAAGRVTRAATASQHIAAGLLPCEVCLPDSSEEALS